MDKMIDLINQGGTGEYDARPPQERGSSLPDDGAERDRLVMAMALAYENSPAHDLIGPMEDAYSALLREISQPQERGEVVAWGVQKTGEDGVWFVSDSWFTAQHYAQEYAHRLSGGKPDQAVIPLYARPPADDARVAELEKQLTASREREERMREAVRKNHQWHLVYDEFDGYKESALYETNMAALAAEKGE